ncbi:FKBP-type peptidyl-prolyl cis-trans isomerase [Arcobacter arenosus]|jgi:FKBP-type peptidyl-prolyl cis-trans isomerase SlyD|uniref:FKBP-type peptidyl-prolyl cis-trans isomerase n=1 Tax=Arcobacter arenosus TaxID=2576037 RepID=UPI003BAA0B27
MAIEKNQVVKLQYELKVNDNLIESNLDADPIEFVFGKGELLEGLEERIASMNEGETRELTVPAIEAYGEYDKSLTEVIPASDFEGIDLEIGLVLEADDEDGNTFKATVIEVDKENVTVDYNHPMAGADLDFKVVINKIV